MKSPLVYFLFWIIFIPLSYGFNELSEGFNASKRELSSFFESSNQIDLKRFGTWLKEKEVEVKVITSDEFNSQSSRNSAFYSEGVVFLDHGLTHEDKKSLEILYFHEILSAAGVGDADYKLSQMINAFRDYSLDIDSGFLSEMIKERIQFSDAFFNEPSENRSFMFNGGSIVGGGGDLNEVKFTQSFVNFVIKHKKKFIESNYHHNINGYLPDLIHQSLNRLRMKKEKCLDDKIIIYRRDGGLIEYEFFYLVFYGVDADLMKAQKTIEELEIGANPFQDNNVVIVGTSRELTNLRYQFDCPL